VYNSELILTKKLFKRLKTQYKLDKCPRCGKTFTLGDTIVSHRCQRFKRERRYYHQECWNEMYI